jgi:hypothetical protein
VEVLEWSESDRQVQRLWFKRDFESLDNLAEHWRQSRVRTTSGLWKLSIFYKVFDDYREGAMASDFPGGDDWKVVDDWIAARPASPTPIIVKALMLISQAQKVEPSRVPTNPYGPNPDILRAIRELLETNKANASRDPHWYTAMLRLLRLENANDDDLIVEHAEALRVHPQYYQTHFEMFSHFVKRWWPNKTMVDGFANTVVEGTKDTEGQMLYARLYSNAVIELNDGAFFSPEKAQWGKLQLGFEQIADAYPSDWNAQHYAFFACMARDRPTSRRLFADFSSTVVREAWQASIVYEQCKDWATQ